MTVINAYCRLTNKFKPIKDHDHLFCAIKELKGKLRDVKTQKKSIKNEAMVVYRLKNLGSMLVGNCGLS